MGVDENELALDRANVDHRREAGKKLCFGDRVRIEIRSGVPFETLARCLMRVIVIMLNSCAIAHLIESMAYAKSARSIAHYLLLLQRIYLFWDR